MPEIGHFERKHLRDYVQNSYEILKIEEKAMKSKIMKKSESLCDPNYNSNINSVTKSNCNNNKDVSTSNSPKRIDTSTQSISKSISLRKIITTPISPASFKGHLQNTREHLKMEEEKKRSKKELEEKEWKQLRSNLDNIEAKSILLYLFNS